ncbi:MAG TPA: DUF1326 domain-containing protein [Bryobacteraceae bacterium]|nr:DUF1326 domain-containing protein [Bryobacteraceae bacterium]
MTESWQVAGKYLESCNCKPACPCVFLSTPTEGDCTVVVGWHIDTGHYGKTDLRGLNAALAVYSPGTMHEVPWRAALYLDASATEDQKNGLLAIFSGQAGGHPARLGAHIGEVMGVATVPIVFEAGEKHRSLKVGEVASIEIIGIEGAGGAEVTVAGHPLCIAPGFPAVVARSKSMRYEDHGYKWILSDRNGLYSPFQYNN